MYQAVPDIIVGRAKVVVHPGAGHNSPYRCGASQKRFYNCQRWLLCAVMTFSAENATVAVPAPKIRLRACTEADIPELSELVLNICDRDNDPADFSVKGGRRLVLLP